ncbi:SusD-like starch-binding protein associating with outer membrane [Neolewinella xylanilytica]|uniref:SusD-like starch-binding protein associating with outer membrane n=1 Tax=Neolewinella xylanilytica TaxID=1514080 RepID=A0A2S6I9L7_9BACT|nr:SusD/RagB family nutrient-binding outer membrane lipoprotein [Neolewinella xylanilytica]PPK88196.1 SusD-like starch-binding protein associating with outer membrane [Neolewinella xylanilytica]
MNSLLSTFLTVFALLLFSGCGADYLDINENPNVATRPPLDGLLANASLGTANNHQSISNGHSSYFVQYLASPNQGSSTDIYDEVTNGGAWNGIYGDMTDLYDLIRFGEEDGLLRHVAIAKILMAVNLGLIVDNWGSAPYSNAFTGEELRPTYDTAEELYASIFTLLEEAIALMPAAADTPEIGAGSDFVYNGNLDLWTKAAYSLRARYLNHLSETGAYDPTAVLSAAENGFDSYEEDAAVTRFAIRNPWAQVAISNAGLVLGGWLSEQFIDAVNGTTYATVDPRLPLLTNENEDGEYVGTPNGEGRAGTGTATSESYLVTEGYFSSENAPLDIITYAELKFIEAEAALAASDQNRANTAFREGVTASMLEIGVDSSAAVAYLNEAYDTDAVTLDDLFREKYVALFLSPETWVDARRYDYAYEDFELPTGAALNSFPLRVIYPDTETNRNAENVPDVTMLTPLFWDTE